MFSSWLKKIHGDQLLSPELSTLFAMAAIGPEKNVDLKATEESYIQEVV